MPRRPNTPTTKYPEDEILRWQIDYENASGWGTLSLTIPPSTKEIMSNNKIKVLFYFFNFQHIQKMYLSKNKKYLRETLKYSIN